MAKIIGNTTATPYPQPDWGQTDDTKPDYIKNKPDISGSGVSSTYTNTDPLVNNLGGILASNHKNGFENVPINDLITELLYPYTKPVVSSITLNPDAGAKKKYVELKVETVKVTVAKKSKDIGSVSLYRITNNNRKNLKTIYNPEISPSGTTLIFDFKEMNINETLDAVHDVEYEIEVVESGDNPNTVKKSAAYSFVYPYFYGVIGDNDEINSDTILSLTEDVMSKGDKKYEFTTNNQCPVFAYPSTYGKLKSIIDPNNFTQTWNCYPVTVDNEKITTGILYYVYVGGASTATNVAYEFNY